MRKPHVVWDFNGTLLEDAAFSVWCDNQVLRSLGLPEITLAQYQSAMCTSLPDFYQALGVDLTQVSYQEINNAFLRHFEEKVHTLPLRAGMMDCVRGIASAGGSQSILSATYEPAVQAQARALGLAPWMLRITGLAHKQAGHKLDRARWHLEKLGLEPASVVLIGDTLGDADMARQLGADCILVAGGHTDRERLEQTEFAVAEDGAALYAMLMGE